MCNKAVDNCLAALKFVPDWSVTNKLIKKLSTALYADENKLYFNEDSDNVTFICNEIGIFNLDLNNINLDDTNYDEDDADTIIHVWLFAWHIKFEKRKTLKKKLSERLIPVAWYTNRWWYWCMSEDVMFIDSIDPIFIEELSKFIGSMQLGGGGGGGGWGVGGGEIIANFVTKNFTWIFLSDFDTFVPKYVLVNGLKKLALVIIQDISRPKSFSSVCEKYILKNIRTAWHIKK